MVNKAKAKADSKTDKGNMPDMEKLERLEKLKAVLQNINSKGKGSIMMLGEDEPIQKIPVIPSGVFPLDVALQVGGFPRGRVCELFGPEGGGKTTIALYLIAACQRNGGVAAFMDMEHALDLNLAAAYGVNVNEMPFAQPDSAEQMLAMIEKMIQSRTVDLIVIDSVAAMASEAELEGSLSDTERVGQVARVMSTALRRLTPIASSNNVTVVFINQLRQAISIGYSQGPTETTPGGRALKFYSSIRIEVKRGKQIKKGEDVIGHELFVKVVKNKLAPPYKTAHCSLIYGKGIPEDLCIVDMAIDREIIKKKGSWLQYRHETLGQGKDGVVAAMQKDPKLKEDLKADIMAQLASHMHASMDDEPDDNMETDEFAADSDAEACMELDLSEADLAEE